MNESKPQESEPNMRRRALDFITNALSRFGIPVTVEKNEPPAQNKDQ